MSVDIQRIWVFDENKLDQAIEAYRLASLEAYPAQAERINITVLAIKDFLDSEYAAKLKMNIRSSEKQHGEH